MSEAIKGYRTLDPINIALINKVKDHAAATEALWDEVRRTVTRTKYVPGTIPDSEPARWCAIARTELQQGYMALVRAIAQPSGF